MNPQNIVYLGLVLLGIGITISAIDPLKQVEYLDVEFECDVMTSIGIDIVYQKCMLTKVEGYLDIEEFKKSNMDWNIDFIENEWVIFEK